MKHKKRIVIAARTPETVTPNAPEAPETPEETETLEAPKPTKEQIRQLVSAYVEAEDNEAVAQDELNQATAAKDAAAKAIFDVSGKGKYKVRDEVLILTSRKARNGDGVSVYFKHKEEDDIIGGD